jgi:hypothetical protein
MRATSAPKVGHLGVNLGPRNARKVQEVLD